MRKLQQHLGCSPGDIMTTEDDAGPFQRATGTWRITLCAGVVTGRHSNVAVRPRAFDPSEWNLEIELRLATSRQIELFLQSA